MVACEDYQMKMVAPKSTKGQLEQPMIITPQSEKGEKGVNPKEVNIGKFWQQTIPHYYETEVC